MFPRYHETLKKCLVLPILDLVKDRDSTQLTRDTTTYQRVGHGDTTA